MQNCDENDTQDVDQMGPTRFGGYCQTEATYQKEILLTYQNVSVSVSHI